MIIEELEEDDEIRETVDGVFLNQHNFVTDMYGIVQSPSKLTVLQMREELAARGLMTEGNRRDIYKRIQVCLLSRGQPAGLLVWGRRHTWMRRKHVSSNDAMVVVQ